MKPSPRRARTTLAELLPGEVVEIGGPVRPQGEPDVLPIGARVMVSCQTPKEDPVATLARIWQPQRERWTSPVALSPSTPISRFVLELATAPVASGGAADDVDPLLRGVRR